MRTMLDRRIERLHVEGRLIRLMEGQQALTLVGIEGLLSSCISRLTTLYNANTFRVAQIQQLKHSLMARLEGVNIGYLVKEKNGNDYNEILLAFVQNEHRYLIAQLLYVGGEGWSVHGGSLTGKVRLALHKKKVDRQMRSTDTVYDVQDQMRNGTW